MLYSTAAVSTKINVARDWRVVSVPEEDSKVIDVAALFSRILEHDITL